MLRFERDDVIPFVRVHLGNAFDGEVVGLRGSAREDDFLGMRVDQGRNLLPRFLSTASSAVHPYWWVRLAAFPNTVKYGDIVSNTRGSVGVVAL